MKGSTQFAVDESGSFQSPVLSNSNSEEGNKHESSEPREKSQIAVEEQGSSSFSIASPNPSLPPHPSAMPSHSRLEQGCSQVPPYIHSPFCCQDPVEKKQPDGETTSHVQNQENDSETEGALLETIGRKQQHPRGGGKTNSSILYSQNSNINYTTDADDDEDSPLTVRRKARRSASSITHTHIDSEQNYPQRSLK